LADALLKPFFKLSGLTIIGLFKLNPLISILAANRLDTLTMSPKDHVIFFLMVSALFLVITAPQLFSDGMFSDGLQYAAIARNMAYGKGSFWSPHLSLGFFNHFYEHPPLALGLQSIWFRLFGDSFLVERFYSLFTFIISGWVIVLIWKHITGSYQKGWIPLFFWITVSTVSWSCANNMLENTLMVFVSLAALFYLKFADNGKIVLLLLSGLMLSLSMLTKGFVGLYIWSMPFFMWLLFRNRSFSRMVFETLLLVLITVLPIVLLLWLSDAAANNMISYFNHQVLDASQNIVTVDSRFAIIKEFFLQSLLPLSVALIIVLYGLLKIGTSQSIPSQRVKWMVLFGFIVMAGVLPIMISVKQRGFYILTVFPFFATAMGLLTAPVIERWLAGFNRKTRMVTGALCLALIFSAITLSIVSTGKIGRDEDRLMTCYRLVNTFGEGSSINIDSSLSKNSSLHGYFARYGSMNLIDEEEADLTYVLAPSSAANYRQYQPIDIHSENYILYKKPGVADALPSEPSTGK
tara:strand:+ start:924 stop:2486 length:1563 start_codon:yes stop_codon:yes gene_type:complete